MKLICAFVFAYADCWFSHAAAHFLTVLQFVLFFKGTHHVQGHNTADQHLNLFIRVEGIVKGFEPVCEKTYNLGFRKV